MYRSRTRRIAKWTGVVVCMLTIVAWGVSLYRGVVYDGNGLLVTLGWSELGFCWFSTDPFPKLDWAVMNASPSIGHWMPHYQTNPSSSQISIPLWIPSSPSPSPRSSSGDVTGDTRNVAVKVVAMI